MNRPPVGQTGPKRRRRRPPRVTSQDAPEIRSGTASVPLAAWLLISLVLLFAVSMIAGLIVGEEFDARTPTALLWLLASGCFFGALILVVSLVGRWVFRRIKYGPEPTRTAASSKPADGWNEFKENAKLVFSVGFLVVGIARMVPMMWELGTESWDLIPRKFKQLAPICKYVTLQPFGLEGAGANDSVEIRLDGSIVGSGRTNRPTVLALKDVAIGRHELRVTTTVHNREFRLVASLRIVDFADYYRFDGADQIAKASQSAVSQDGELSVSTGPVQPSLVLEEWARAGIVEPACSTLPPGPSIQP